jgi:ATP-dependent exoDNAse (exonuclease V) alpha subunit
MDQTLALEILHDGHNVLLTGPAGSGKTYVLNRFIRQAKQNGKHVSVTATTGLAATHLGGSTIHSWSGIGIHDYMPTDLHKNLTKTRVDTIKKTDVLVLDEISMLHDYRLDMVDQIARKVRENDEPFGGIQVILCGDFFQLPPVSRQDQRAGSFVVSSEVWDELDPVVCYLEEQHRQDDDEFLGILNAIRAGDVRRAHAETLLARKDADLSHIGAVTELHTTNVDVESINSSELAAIDGEEHVYEMITTGAQNYVDNLKRSCLASERLVLKKGALVMCIKNNQEKRYVNGSLGTIEDFELLTDYPIVRLKNGRTVTVSPETWELRDGDRKRAGLTQIPLRLAWAITVHKSQGMTLDGARIDLRRAFVEGMGYVALSRVRSLDTLSLSGINSMALKVSEDALAIDKHLRKQSKKDAERFEHLRAKAQTRKTAKPKHTPGTWSEKLAKMREQYPNAYRPWKEQEDSELTELFTAKGTVGLDELTKKFGRHPGSIRARLQKLFGEDAVI